VKFIAGSSITSTYDWIWKTGGTATGDTGTKSYTANVMDEVKLTATSTFGCQDSAFLRDIMIRNILVNVTPGSLCDTSAFGGCNPLQVGFGIELYSSLPPPMVPCGYEAYPLPVATYLWDFGDGSPPSTAANPTHTFSSVSPPTDYIVTCSI